MLQGQLPEPGKPCIGFRAARNDGFLYVRE